MITRLINLGEFGGDIISDAADVAVENINGLVGNQLPDGMLVENILQFQIIPLDRAHNTTGLHSVLCIALVDTTLATTTPQEVE